MDCTTPSTEQGQMGLVPQRCWEISHPASFPATTLSGSRRKVKNWSLSQWCDVTFRENVDVTSRLPWNCWKHNKTIEFLVPPREE